MASSSAASPVRYAQSETFADSVVTFNEVFYHPADDDAGLEWIEFHNQHTVMEDLSDWVIEGGVSFRFPKGVRIPGGGFLVVAADPGRFQKLTGMEALGPFQGRLSDDSDHLVLRNLHGRLMDELDYGDSYPWPVGADGSGATLAKRVEPSPSSPPENWSFSRQLGGTPGASNFPAAGPEPTAVVDGMIGARHPARWRVPEAAGSQGEWRRAEFSDSNWVPGTNGFGFDKMPGFLVPEVARYYAFEGSSTDVSGNGFHGILQGGARTGASPAPVVGSVTALELDGVDDAVRIPDSGAWPRYTLSLWVRPLVVRPGNLVVRSDDAGPTVSFSHQLRITDRGFFEHYTYDGQARAITGTTRVEAGRWYHVAATAEGGGMARLYVNGVEEGTAVPVGTLWETGARWFLAVASAGFPLPFQGGLDEFGIWDRVLDPGTIRILAGGGVPPLKGRSATGGLGAWVSTDVSRALDAGIPGVWIRYPFDAPSPSGYSALNLVVRYDDGFVVWLNGQEVARRQAPEALEWNSVAVRARLDSDETTPEVIDLTGFAGVLRPTGNLLSVHSLNVFAEDSDQFFHVELSGTRRTGRVGGALPVVISEVGSGDGPEFFCELAQVGSASVPTAGLRIRSSAGGEYRFPSEVWEPGKRVVLGTNELGFAIRSGLRLYLLDADGGGLLDAVSVLPFDQARRSPVAGGRMERSVQRTPGSPNTFEPRDAVVINEILYHAPVTEEEWIELYNRSAQAVDLSGWRLDGEVRFVFPAGVRIEAGEYLVVTDNRDEMVRRLPGIRVVGDWSGRLSGRGGRVELVDGLGNVVDEVHYHDDSPWPGRADGGGSSLELVDPRADNRSAGVWAASDESRRSEWQTYRYRARAVTPVKGPALNGFHEFRMGLLSDGEVWVDDVSVVEDPDGTARSLIQNGTFDDARAWRLLGNHSHSSVIDDPERPGNRVLRLVATDARGYMNNQLETTLKAGGVVVPVVTGRTYEIAFRAKWIGGSRLLHTELYYNKVARTTELAVPDRHGTPGTRNSAWVPNVGPTYAELEHEPLVPKPGDAVTVRVRADDPDQVASLNLFSSVNGGAWQSRPMTLLSAGHYTATISAQALDAVVQFYVEGRDTAGAVSWMPARGPESRALYRVDTRVARSPRKAFRFILTPADGRRLDAVTNMMSDDRVGATVVWDEREVFYDCGVHLHGSMFSRNNLDATPYNMKFPADQRFRGVHRSVQLNRGVIEEILAKHVQVQAGIPGMYEDIVELFSHRRGNAGAARLSLAQYNDIYLGSQYEDGTDGMLYNMEGIRVLTTTHNGSPEGIKLGQPVGWVGDYDVMDLGDDPEQYRFSTTLRNNRARNDHRPYIAMAKAFSLTGAALEQAVPRVIDVDQWMRYYAVLTLFEIGDTYTLGNPHNIGFYARPSDGRVLAMPHDWDFFFANGDNSALWGNQNLSKVIARPVFTRLLYGHLHDLVNGVFTTNYLAPFVAHFGQVAGQNYSGYNARIRARGQYVRSRLPAVVPFEITSNGGSDFSTSGAETTLEGRGWIDVREIRTRQGTDLPVFWVDASRWRVMVPLAAKTNRFELEAYNVRGEKVGEDSIGVTTSGVDDAQRRSLRISELMYHPADVTAAEAAAGFDEDDFEFVEVGHFGHGSVSLAGVRLEGAVDFAFPAGTNASLAAGGRVLVAKRQAALKTRYVGESLPVAGEYQGTLPNAGGTLRLLDAGGALIQEVTYADQAPWPVEADGLGYSLEWLGPDAPGTGAAVWRTSRKGGTPGKERPEPPVPVTAEVVREGSRVRLKVLGQGGRVYQLQASRALGGEAWLDVGEPQRPAFVTRLEWLETVDGGPRFFRVRVE